jgi:hypothetical protein
LPLPLGQFRCEADRIGKGAHGSVDSGVVVPVRPTHRLRK